MQTYKVVQSHNSDTIAHIHTKFSSVTKTKVPETEMPSNITSVKIQDGGQLPFENTNRHNSAAFHISNHIWYTST